MTTIRHVWDYSPETEAQHIIWTAYQIKNGFYFSKGWLLSPSPVPRHTRVVYFPKKNYDTIPHFWDKAMKMCEGVLINDKEYVKQVAHLFKSDTLNFIKLKRDWDKVYAQFVSGLQDIMPGIFEGVDTIEIRPVNYGVRSTAFSKYVNPMHPEQHIVVYVRSDMDISDIASSILIDRLHKDSTYSHFIWEEKMAIKDFIINNTKIKKLFPQHIGTISTIRQKQQAKLVKASNQYFKSLGLAQKTLLEIIDNQIVLNGSPLLLSPIEKNVLCFLIRKSGSVVSFDQIGDVMWGDESSNKFSLYAIAKVIERIRHKIEKKGIYPEIIQTKRSEGYVLLG